MDIFNWLRHSYQLVLLRLEFFKEEKSPLLEHFNLFHEKSKNINYIYHLKNMNEDYNYIFVDVKPI